MYQIIVTISFAHVINIQLVEGLDNTNEFKYKFWLIFLSLVCLGSSLYWITISLINFSGRFYNIIIILITTVCGVVLICVSISNFIKSKRLLTGLYIFSFITYMSWSALNSQPENESSEIEINNKLSIIDISVGMVYLFMATCYLGFYIKKKSYSGDVRLSDGNEKTDQKEINKSPMLEEEGEGRDAELLNHKNEENRRDDLDVSAAYYYFHIFMIFMAIYYCMLLTNWSVIDANTSDFKILAKSWTSFWVKLISVFATCFLYLWIMIAPVVFPDREFDF